MANDNDDLNLDIGKKHKPIEKDESIQSGEAAEAGADASRDKVGKKLPLFANKKN